MHQQISVCGHVMCVCPLLLQREQPETRVNSVHRVRKRRPRLRPVCTAAPSDPGSAGASFFPSVSCSVKQGKCCGDKQKQPFISQQPHRSTAQAVRTGSSSSQHVTTGGPEPLNKLTFPPSSSFSLFFAPLQRLFQTI